MSLRDFLDVNNSNFSYFINKYEGTTRFQIQTLEVNTDSDTRFGGTSWTQLPHKGDLISRIILRVDFEETGVAFVQSAGTYMIDYIELYFERQLIERIYGEYIELVNDLTVPQGKQSSLATLHGKGVYPQSPYSFYVVLPFSFTRKGIPLVALKDQKIELKIQYRDTSVFALQQNDAGNFIVPYDRQTPVSQTLYIDYVYLSDAEAESLQKKELEYLLEQVQFFQGTIPAGTSNVTFNLNFTNPIKDMYFILQDSNSAPYSYSSNLQSLNLVLNGQDVIPATIGLPLYLRNVQPMDYYTRSPTHNFYVYSFCLDPENDDPTGHLNFGRITRQQINLTVTPSSVDTYFRVYARSYNIFKIEGEKGLMLFNNLQ
ncbi:hypothetical protein EBT25_00825 [bacterium]|nr:hypothetical protein [bacterium]